MPGGGEGASSGGKEEKEKEDPGFFKFCTPYGAGSNPPASVFFFFSLPLFSMCKVNFLPFPS